MLKEGHVEGVITPYKSTNKGWKERKVHSPQKDKGKKACKKEVNEQK
jgi:hypothetical protein